MTLNIAKNVVSTLPILLLASACSLVNQESKQDPLPPSPEQLVADKKQQKQCQLYEEAINSLTTDVNEM